MNPFARTTAKKKAPPRARLNVERLEDRTLLSVSLQYSSNLTGPLVSYGNPVSFTQFVTAPDRPNSQVSSFTATVKATGLPSGVSVATAPAVITLGPTFPATQSWVVTFALSGVAPGSYGIKVKAHSDLPSVSEGSGTDVTLVVAANRPPTLTSPGNRTFDELTPLNFTLVATDPDVPAQTLTYSISSGAQPGMTLNSATGAFSWTPSETQDGVYNVTFLVTDSAGAFDQKTIAIAVREVN